MKKEIRVLIILTIILIIFLAIFAKTKIEESNASDGSDTIAIFGYIMDENDNPISGVTVGIKDYNGENRGHTQTDNNGYYSIEGLDKTNNYYVYYKNQDNKAVESIKAMQYQKLSAVGTDIKRLEVAYLKKDDNSNNDNDIKSQLSIVRSRIYRRT